MSDRGYRIGFAIIWQLAWLLTVAGAPTVLAPACVLGSLGLLTVHLLRRGKHLGPELRTLCAALLCGAVGDSLLSVGGLVAYAPDLTGGQLAPVWILLLWAWFACALHHPLAFLRERPALAALLGAISGPVAYFGGVRLDAVAFPAGWWSALAIATLYAIALPVLCHIARPAQRKASELSTRELAHAA